MKKIFSKSITAFFGVACALGPAKGAVAQDLPIKVFTQLVTPFKQDIVLETRQVWHFVVPANLRPAVIPIQESHITDVYRRVIGTEQYVTLAYRKNEKTPQGDWVTEITVVGAKLTKNKDGTLIFSGGSLPVSPLFRKSKWRERRVEVPFEGKYVWGFYDPKAEDQIHSNGLGTFEVIPKRETSEAVKEVVK